MAELITQAEYARRRDVSRQYIHRLVTQGKIPTDELKRIDPDVADAVLAQISDPARRLNDMPEDPDNVAADDQDPAAETTGNGHTSFARFRSAREGYQAQLAKMDYEERAGKLVRKEEIDREAFEAARLIAIFQQAATKTISNSLRRKALSYTNATGRKQRNGWCPAKTIFLIAGFITWPPPNAAKSAASQSRNGGLWPPCARSRKT